MRYTYPLDSTQATLDLVGGKGQALAKLCNLDLPIPTGFHVTTTAYQKFITEHTLQEAITQALQTNNIEQASADIRALFAQHNIPTDIQEAIQTAYQQLGQTAVAVRSSATAEDLPDMSFAGQQDTYLNIHGADALQQAVRDCWASLWTTRAITYRNRMGIDHAQVSMGVVVQTMVTAVSSGILFTANPTTGARDEMVINASYGLGEAIVGGHVTPDTYIVNRSSGDLTTVQIGTKESQIVADGTHGILTQPVEETARQQQTLTPAQIKQLMELSQAVEHFFGLPQDIEWAFDGEQCWLLQSRPITNLPSAPLTVEWEPTPPHSSLIRRQVVEHMPGPLSPLFDKLYLDGLDSGMDKMLDDFKMDLRLEDFVKRPFFITANGYAYCSADYHFSLDMFKGVLPAYFKMLPDMLRNANRYWEEEKLPHYLAIVKQWQQLDLTTAQNAQLWFGIQDLSNTDARYWYDVSIIVGLAKVTDEMFNRFVGSLGDNLSSGLFLRGYDSQTLHAQLELEAIARQIHQSDSLMQQVKETPTDQLLTTLQAHEDGAAPAEALQTYIGRYGHQIYTLDFAEPTQGEDATPILMGLKALVDQPKDSRQRQSEIVRQRDALIQETANTLSTGKKKLFQTLLGWAQKYAPHREDAVFYMGSGWPTLRRLAHELGARFTQQGILATPEQLFYLYPSEIETAVITLATQQPTPDYKQLAQERFELREARKQLHPPGKIPDVPFKFGPIDMSIFETQKVNEQTGNIMNGFGVSPGTITAPASVILSPADFANMQPNTILVCPTTTPAWTPLFSHAKGLVTDIGGILAHGSIVAREYGIPAVMGLGNATQRIQNGQLLRLDGNTGEVELIAN